MAAILDQLHTDALDALARASDAAALEAWRIEFLGSKGRLKAAMGAIKDVPPADKPAFGAKLNTIAKAVEDAFTTRKASLGSAAAAPAGPTVDVTEPGLIETRELGRAHIITRVRDELVDVFARMGFSVAEGPELEDDAHNFVKLNIPPGHPAREPIDNFYIDDPAKVPAPRMLRSQTSTVQVRVMEAAVAAGQGTLQTPIKIISPGRVYRPDTVDATHSFMFHQIEGLCIDRHVSMADLKGTLLHFARAYFGPEAEIRLRPTFFPFTEPSAELDLKIRLRPDQPVRWMELGGCGIVHPNVLRASGIDPDTWTGYAFGFGIERLAMGKYAIPDIRMLYANDLRFLRQL
ncbi:MAG: phenylalanine--tRNA ligase subunit alpha [Phycisphaerales bacterium]|jgi:phenylalanyl-tRNA synthetase alpha chain|nr:phenylalanine--tRNA ligase subunit alpha [Phycisphaerales bacterium]